MKQDFSEVTAEQLGVLFPILLEEHKPTWKEEYDKEKQEMLSLLGDQAVRISHIGSTSVSGLLAKPTIDLLVEVKADTDIASMKERMVGKGYVVNTPKSDLIMLLKGYTPQGFRGQAVHIHVRYSGDWEELYFRDYLRGHSDTAAEYAALKLELKAQYPHDRDGYTEAKGAFVQRITAIARQEFPGRYQP